MLPANRANLLQRPIPRIRPTSVPAFLRLGAPYWDSEAKAAIVGMTRSTGKAEIVKAAEECIAYQITDLVLLMQQESGLPITEIRVDGRSD